MPKKIYLAFLSSEFEKLKEQRKEIIDALLDFDIMPVGMEHFTTSHDGNFSDIKRFIDQSDFFILLMSNTYGSTDEEGRSWTEREFDYAHSSGKKILAIVLKELSENIEKKKLSEQGALLSEQEEKQLEFYAKISRLGFARSISGNITVDTILRQFFGKHDNYVGCAGWEQAPSALSEAALKEWQDKHRVFDIGGTWYHMHLNNDDKKYIRIGDVVIRQDFTPENYRRLSIRGRNFGVLYYDAEQGCFELDKDKNSEFYGEYTLDDEGKIFGIFNTERMFDQKFIATNVTMGKRRGIHDFFIDSIDTNAVTSRINGAFHDEAPSPKMGTIYLFRDEFERDENLFKQRASRIFKLNKLRKKKLPADFKPQRKNNN